MSNRENLLTERAVTQAVLHPAVLLLIRDQAQYKLTEYKLLAKRKRANPWQLLCRASRGSSALGELRDRRNTFLSKKP